jgi:predicted transcriptional regulator
MTGAEMRCLRRRLRISQTELGKELDMAQSQISDYENERNRKLGTPLAIPRTVELACRWLEGHWAQLKSKGQP